MADRSDRSPETYTYHLGVYSKLVRGADPDGPIKLGVEARINGRSAGFPADLSDLCRPATFFRDQPMVTEIDPRKTPGGVFVYRPAYLRNRHLGLFARIEARSEEGAARAGRRFTHCAVLIVEDKWEPGLLYWAAEMLFTARHGGRCWGNPVTERDEERNELRLPPLDRDLLDSFEAEPDTVLPLALHEDGSMQVRGRMPDTTRQSAPYVAMATDIAEFLSNFDYFIHGRWLSVALGIGPQVEGHGRGYFFRYDMRSEDAKVPGPVSLPFRDATPPLIAGDFVAESRGGTAALVDWATLGPPLSGAVKRLNNFRPENLWADQRCPSIQTEPAVAARQRVPTRSIASNEAIFPMDDDITFSFIRKEMDTARAQPEVALPFPMPRYLNTRDGIEPGLPTLDDIFDAAALEGIRPAFRNLTGRILLLDPEGGFGTFHPTPDDDRILVAFETMAMVMIARCALADPEEMKPWVLQQLAQPAMPVIGFPAPTDRSGLLQTILVGIFNGAGLDQIADWCEIQRRRESNLKIQKARVGLIDPGYQTYTPNRQRIRDFFLWLDAVPWSAEPCPGYDGPTVTALNDIFGRWISMLIDRVKARIAPPN